jgi:hypothetical protein
VTSPATQPVPSGTDARGKPVGTARIIAGASTGIGWIPDRSRAHLMDDGISWNYTTWLNIVFLVLAAALVIRFVRTGGIPMPRMMGGAPPTDGDGHQHHHGPAAAGDPRHVAHEDGA